MKQVLGATKFLRYLLVITICTCSSMNLYSQTEYDTTGIDIPIGGNSWLLKSLPGEEITKDGFINWKSPSTICRTFFRTSKPGIIRVWLFLDIPDTGSIVQVTIGTVSNTIPLNIDHGIRLDAGTFKINDTGYIQIDVQAIQRTNAQPGKLTNIRIEGLADDDVTGYVRYNEENYFYWSRRGASVHLNYKVDSGFNTSWFYNQVTVPVGSDVIGSYFMANGFAEGYFGMQVNSQLERRILFSIWSPFETDDPESIPDSLKIKLIAKGSDVHVGEFGNEGSGGQSFLIYNWKPGFTYGFLTHAQPNKDNSTTYTSWFFAPEIGKWKLIASFKRSSTTTYLNRLHSFLENFEPETGMIRRKVLFSAQFIAEASGEWKEINEASFSVDQTGRKNFRKDYFGAVEGKSFLLENCGFFNTYEIPGTLFTRKLSGKPPAINFSSLPSN